MRIERREQRVHRVRFDDLGAGHGLCHGQLQRVTKQGVIVGYQDGALH